MIIIFSRTSATEISEQLRQSRVLFALIVVYLSNDAEGAKLAASLAAYSSASSPVVIDLNPVEQSLLGLLLAALPLLLFFGAIYIPLEHYVASISLLRLHHIPVNTARFIIMLSWLVYGLSLLLVLSTQFRKSRIRLTLKKVSITSLFLLFLFTLVLSVAVA